MDWGYAAQLWHEGVVPFANIMGPWFRQTQFPIVIGGAIAATVAWWSLRKIVRL
jgi:hypothetical protein